MYFNNISTIQELKKVYFTLAKKFHPDINKDPQSTATMQQINNEYDRLFDQLKSKINFDNFKTTENADFSACNYTYKQETSDIFRDIISKIIHIPDIEIEICGYWLWISGNTKPYKEIFKDNGFYWSSKKFEWYWRPAEYKSFNRKTYTKDQIRSRYGSMKINNDPYLVLS